MRPSVRVSIIVGIGLQAACGSPTGPRLVTDEGLMVELLLPSDTIIAGDTFTLTTSWRNDGPVPLVLSGGSCLAHHTVRFGRREVNFPGTGAGMVCGAAVWTFTLAPGETKYDTQQAVAAAVTVVTEFTVETDLLFMVQRDDRRKAVEGQVRAVIFVGPADP